MTRFNITSNWLFSVEMSLFSTERGICNVTILANQISFRRFFEIVCIETMSYKHIETCLHRPLCPFWFTVPCAASIVTGRESDTPGFEISSIINLFTEFFPHQTYYIYSFLTLYFLAVCFDKVEQIYTFLYKWEYYFKYYY